VPSPLVLGVDLGTTRIRVAAFDADGRQLVARTSPSPLCEIGPGRVEQRVEDIRVAADTATRAVTAALGRSAADVRAIGLTGQMGGITALDGPGRPVIAYDSPLDLRCAPFFERYFVPHLSTLLAKAGIAPQWGQKLLYWRDEHPTTWDRIARFTTLAGFYAADLVHLPGDQTFADPSYAALSGLWSGGTRWDEELCELVGITTDKLPRLVPPNTVVGSLSRERAQALGLSPGLPVVTGTGDAVASLLGAGAVTSGRLFDLSGTASVLVACSDRLVADPTRRLLSCLPSAQPGLWYVVHGLFGGQAVRWFAEQFLPSTDAHAELATRLAAWDLRAAALDEATDPSSLFFLPQLGGRWHPPRPEAKGGWVGLTWGSRPEHLYRAILESIAYEFAIGLERMRQLVGDCNPTEVTVFGGGARSAFWNQLKADVLGVPYRPLRAIEFGARGAALIAAQAIGIVRDIQTTATRVEFEAAVLPRPDQTLQRQMQLRRYRVLVEEVELAISRLEMEAVPLIC